MRGIRVLDLSEAVPGAYTGRLLASMGADVVVGEPAGGSPMRSDATSWEYLAAYKSSVVLEPGLAALTDAAGFFDVVIVSADGPHLTNGLEVGEVVASVQAAHPDVVVVAVTPFGLTGPYAAWRGGPLELWAAGGHMALTGDADRHPLPGGGAWDSYLVGAIAAVGAQGGVFESVRTGRGVTVDVGGMEALAGSHQWSISLYTHSGAVKHRAGNRLAELHHPICLYPCVDGWVCIAAASLHQWEGLCIAMEQVELLADDSLASAAVRFERADELDEIIIAWTQERTTAEVVEACQSNFCPAGRVADLPDLLDDDQLVQRGYWKAVSHLGPGARMPGAPFLLPSTPAFSPAPELGHSTSAPARSGAASVTTPSGDDEASPSPLFRPLDGVRVLELTISWAGPLAARFLADLGAEVIKVEHPTSRGVAVLPPDPDAEPDPWEWGELPPISVRNGLYPDATPGHEWWNRMSHWNKMNRSKRSLCLDVKGPGGREVFERLVATADIVINNYSPRGVRSLGIDHETLRGIKNDVVTVAMSGFGATGPGAEAVSWGPILDAASGLASSTGYPGSGPYKQGVAYPDPIGGSHGAAAVLGAWWEHQRSGEPVHVDLSQLETLLGVAGDQALEASITGQAPPRRGARSARHAPAGVYACAGEDRWLVLTVYTDEDWVRLVGVIPELASIDGGTVDRRREAHDEIDGCIERWTTQRSPHAAMSELQQAGVAAAIVATNQDLVEDPHLESRRFVVTVDHPACGPGRFPGSPFLVDGQALEIRPVSSLGADNDAVLTQLGVAAVEQATLAEAGTIATQPPA